MATNGGDDRLTGGSGRDHMFGGEGSDIFVFEFGDFRTVVRDFDATEDQIDITDFAFLLPDDFGSDFLIPDVGDALNLPFWVNPDAVRETNGNLVFNFGTGDVLTLSNTTLADLSVDNFVLPDDFFVPDVLG
ncbi:MAG: Ca2+-binding RTX toxin-like protein [Reinekea sp.]